MTKHGSLEVLHDELQAEIKTTAQKLAKELFPELNLGAEKLNEPEYLRYVRRNWADGEFRQKLLKQVGPRRFVDTARAALKQQQQELEAPAVATETAEPSVAEVLW